MGENKKKAAETAVKTNKKQKEHKESFFSRHRGLKFFLLSFLICIILFTAAACYIFYPMVCSLFSKINFGSLLRSNGAASSSQAVISSSAAPVDDKDTFNMLLTVCDDTSNKPVEVAVIRLDQANNRIVTMIVPTNLQLSLNGSGISLSDLYAKEGMGFVQQYTAATLIKFDYTCLIHSSDFPGIIDKLSGLNFDVPENISYREPDYSILSFQKGSQHLSGAQVYALLCYNSYANRDAERYQVESDLLKSFIMQKMAGNYLDNAPVIYKNIFPSLKTTFTLAGITARHDTIEKITDLGSSAVVTPPWKTVTSAATGGLPQYDPNTLGQFYTYFDAK